MPNAIEIIIEFNFYYFVLQLPFVLQWTIKHLIYA